jgi:hypothetical protein
MRNRKRMLVLLSALVIGLFVSGAVWRGFNPRASENPDQDAQLLDRQDGYYLCLHLPAQTPAEMYRLIKKKLPHDNIATAIRGCREAQNR